MYIHIRIHYAALICHHTPQSLSLYPYTYHIHALYILSMYRHYPQILLRGASVVWVRRSPPPAHASAQHIQRLPHRFHHSDRINLTSKAPDKPSHSLSCASVPSFSSALAAYTQQTRSSINSSCSSSSKVKQS